MSKRNPQVTRMLRISLWLGSLLLALVLGAYNGEDHSQTAPNETLDNTGATPVVAVPETVQAEVQPRAPEQTVEDVSPAPDISSADYSLERFRLLQATGSSRINANAELYLFLKNVPVALIPALVEEIMTRQRWGSHIEPGQMLGILYGRWAEEDLNAALQSAYALPVNGQSDWALGAVMSRYTQADPLAAFEFYKKYLQGRSAMNDDAGASVIGGLTRVDPERALLEVVNLLHETSDRSGCYTFTFARVMLDNKRMNEAVTLVTGIEDEVARGELIHALFNHYANRNDPASAMGYIEQLDNPADQRTAILALAGSWSDENQDKGAEWAYQLSDSQLRAEALSDVMSNWYYSNVEEAAQWLNEHSSEPALDPSIVRLVQYTMNSAKDPGTAFSWALGLSNRSTDRADISSWTLKEWMKQGASPEEALQLIDESTLRAREKTTLRQIVEESQSESE